MSARLPATDALADLLTQTMGYARLAPESTVDTEMMGAGTFLDAAVQMLADGGFIVTRIDANRARVDRAMYDQTRGSQLEAGAADAGDPIVRVLDNAAV